WQGDSDYGFFPFPVINETQPRVTLTVVDGLILSRGERRVEEAKKALGYFTRPDPQYALCKASGNFTPLRSVPDDFYDSIHAHIASESRGDLAFAYDLDTLPEVEHLVLPVFAQFLDAPDRYPELLKTLSQRLQPIFQAAKPKRPTDEE
ncbi:MAG: hypothetical protein ACYTGH_00660, partial [Planctomycetota bacterium]